MQRATALAENARPIAILGSWRSQAFSKSACARSHGDGPITSPIFAAAEVSRRLFDRGVIAETCGPFDQVLKLLSPLTIPLDALDGALATIDQTLGELPQTAIEDAA